MKTCLKSVTTLIILLFTQSIYAFDHQHSLWNSILQETVHISSNALESQVDYTQIKKNSSQLKHYLEALSSVKRNEFQQWSLNERKAFLVNAYNAFTIQLVIDHYPDIQSIKDIGSFFSTPWKKQFINLLGNKYSLDDLEHDLLLKEGRFNDPFLHVALVCASISCPALINEAYTSEKIEQQLTTNMKNFLSDKSRNRYNPQSNILEVSKIFKWYQSDFERGYRGLNALSDLFARYAAELTNGEEEQAIVTSKNMAITYLDYNWDLNDYQK